MIDVVLGRALASSILWIDREESRSALAHSFGGLGGGALAYLLLDADADISVDVFPILERTI
jgi:hypothetical protein